MKIGRLWLPILIGISLISSCAYAAKTVNGTLLLSTAKAGMIILDTDSGKTSYKPAKDIKVVRGQIGLDPREASLSDLAPGDRVSAVIDSNEEIISLKAYFGLIKGILDTLKDDKLHFRDGRYVRVNSGAVVVMEDGMIGDIKKIKPGSLLTCRVNPNTSEAWTILVSSPTMAQQTKTKDTAPAVTKLPPAAPGPDLSKKTAEKQLPKAVKPEIKSLTFSAPAELKEGDLITVDMSGTPKAKAVFEIKQLVELTKMSEISSGSYRAVVMVPKGKTVEDAPLMGYLSINGVKSSVIQASRLISVGKQNKPVMEQHPIPAVEVTPVKLQTPEKQPDVSKPAPTQVIPAQPTVEVKQEQKKGPVDIVLTNPPDQASIQRALLIRGTAEPDAKVQVFITYTNGLSGILKLSGQVMSQAIAVAKNGEFRFGPIALEGPLATNNLEFTIKAYYPDYADHATAVVKVHGVRK